MRSIYAAIHCYFAYRNSHQLHRWFVAIFSLLGFSSGLFTPINSMGQPLAAGKDKFLGCATSANIYRYLDRYWNQVTPGNEGKWGSVEVVQGQYNWAPLDKIYTFAANHKMPFKYHTLIWGQQQPGWINSLDSTAQRAKIEEWIRRVGERYPKMAMVDVVNEPFHAPPAYKNALGGDGITGWDWVITAFQLARKYCPDTTKLLINEYNILHSNSQTINYINLINLLKDRNLIDGIGIQGHYFEFRSDLRATSNIYIYDINTIKANLDKLATLGLPIYISEFDIDEPVDLDQLAQYKIYFPIFWSHSAVKGITLWGYIQGDTWAAHPYTYLLLADGTERPALQWLRTYIASPLPPTIISPNATGGVSLRPLLIWHASKTATSYHVQLATLSTFVPSSIVLDTTITDTLIQVGPLDPNRRYFWRVEAWNEHGSSGYSMMAIFMTGDQTATGTEMMLPNKFELFQNHPNPFNTATIIEFELPRDCWVHLKVYDVLGNEIATLIDQKMKVGRHSVAFQAENLKSGIYFYQIRAGEFTATKRMVIVK
ncbi:MAG: endo-1,4-beta-xylanase [candidate division KSB1 bacterium]|nr:endo-1,4-beta-xylanase [candidate division KSB1 bacterium]